ncbi:MAG: DUF1501 domain-containing protein [Planctomycetales bacterium]|nr:DUF1501 domain-containing protein [Planctomycetales bacterium]
MRRELFSAGSLAMGTLAMAAMSRRDAAAATLDQPGHLNSLHYPPKAKRVIYLFQSGAPSQLDLLDYKPLLNERHGTELPASVRGGQRLTGMSGNQSSLPLVGSPWKFSRHGQSGAQLSELLPHLAGVADELCIVRSMHTEAINHGPGVTFVQTGSMFPGRPSMGAWLDYGLGRENDDLPSFVVMVTKDKGGQPLVSRLWGSGFLPSRHQGVRFRSGKDPVLYLNNPDGIDRDSRGIAVSALTKLHQMKLDQSNDPLVAARISQYELAYRMQASIPDATDLSDEPESTFHLYGPDAKNPGSFAANCVLARRLAERGVRFIQLYHPGWDHHGGLQNALPRQCNETDQPAAALVADLKQRGLLDDTLVVWGGEFGRTNYCQGKLGPNNFGRDHHPRCFSMWMAGGGIKPGMTFGTTDEFGYNISEDPVHIHDLQATILHQLGIDHERLTYKYQGRNFRLTDVHGKVQHALLT